MPDRRPKAKNGHTTERRFSVQGDGADLLLYGEGDTHLRALREAFGAFVDFVAETLDEGKLRGIVRRDVDSRLVAWQFLSIGLTLDLIHLLGFSSDIDRDGVERWGRGYLETLGTPRGRRGIGPAARTISELVAPQSLVE